MGAGSYLREHLRAGDRLDVSSPRGSFILQSGERPVVLLSAGIGATPVLAMLYALAAARSPRRVLWLHAARDGEHHPFAGEVRDLMRALPHSGSYVCYSSPGAADRVGEDFDATGRFSRSVFEAVGVPPEANVYLCGPPAFMAGMREELATLNVAPERMYVELFNGSESMTPGVVGAAVRTPHLPADDLSRGPLVSFARSGIAAHWNASTYQSILELAEPATSRFVGRVGPVFVTAAKAVSFPGTSSMHRRHSTRRPTATFSCAARNRAATWSSTCES